jgi:hypothetical protein
VYIYVFVNFLLFYFGVQYIRIVNDDKDQHFVEAKHLQPGDRVMVISDEGVKYEAIIRSEKGIIFLLNNSTFK